MCAFPPKAPQSDDIPVTTRCLGFKYHHEGSVLWEKWLNVGLVQGSSRQKWESYCARKKKVSKTNEVMSKVHRTNLIAFPLGKFGTL